MTMQTSPLLAPLSWSTRGSAVMRPRRGPNATTGDAAAADPTVRRISLRVVVPLVAATSLLLWTGLIAAGWFLLHII
jgi:hypothetical protein